MTTLEAIHARHAVRSYRNEAIPADTAAALQEEIDACNREGRLHIQLVTNEPKAFDSMMAHYGKFSGVQSYIALVGKKSAGLDERLGYYGERVALKAQTLGLNTCWVAMSFSKGAAKKNIQLGSDEKLVCVLSLGYGTTQGTAHSSKPMEALCKTDAAAPDWFRSGMEAAMLAPTAMNQQKFCLTLSGGAVKAENLGGFYSEVDLGIVKYHFEIGAGKEHLF
jgi:nitroreductase